MIEVAAGAALLILAVGVGGLFMAEAFAIVVEAISEFDE